MQSLCTADMKETHQRGAMREPAVKLEGSQGSEAEVAKICGKVVDGKQTALYGKRQPRGEAGAS